MPARVPINGFGRIVAASCAPPSRADPISRSSRSTTLTIPRRSPACSPRRLRAFPDRVRCDGDRMAYDGREVRVLGERDPGDLPWADLGVEVVIEATGNSGPAPTPSATSARRAQGHPLGAEQGARSVDANVVLGVDFHEVYRPRDPRHHHRRVVRDELLAPVAKVLHAAVGVRHGRMTTCAPHTSDPSLLDGPHTDLRRAAQRPSTWCRRAPARRAGPGGPRLEGRLNSIAVRVPRRPARWSISRSRPSMPRAPRRSTGLPRARRLRADDRHPRLQPDPIVSSDMVKSTYSSIYDAPLTTVMNESQVESLPGSQRVGVRDPPCRACRARAGAAPRAAARAPGAAVS